MLSQSGNRRQLITPLVLTLPLRYRQRREQRNGETANRQRASHEVRGHDPRARGGDASTGVSVRIGIAGRVL